MVNSFKNSLILPTIALIGRQNVGKSTLFNKITKSKEALVANIPGLTRDPKIGRSAGYETDFLVVDTGGLISLTENDEIGLDNSKFTLEICEEVEVIFFIVDSKTGLLSLDRDILTDLRKHSGKVFLVANKSENINADILVSEFSELGLKKFHCISAIENLGIGDLIEEAMVGYAQKPTENNQEIYSNISIIGKPNVGKSTLINRLIGYKRVATSEKPGTTRDCIDVIIDKNNKKYRFIDTAGLRRKSRVHEYTEKLSVISTLKSMIKSEIIVLMIDADSEISAQDLTLIGSAINYGKPLMITVNKWDLMRKDTKTIFINELERRLNFISYAPIVFLSAHLGSGIREFFKTLNRVIESFKREVKTNQINLLLQKILKQHQPPLVNGKQIKLRFAHIANRNPFTIAVHGNQDSAIPNSFRRFLENQFREKLGLIGVPVKVIFKKSENPFSGNKNKLNERQLNKRKRIIKYRKKSK